MSVWRSSLLCVTRKTFYFLGVDTGLFYEVAAQSAICNCTLCAKRKEHFRTSIHILVNGTNFLEIHGIFYDVLPVLLKAAHI
jgi:hypothetical protein